MLFKTYSRFSRHHNHLSAACPGASKASERRRQKTLGARRAAEEKEKESWRRKGKHMGVAAAGMATYLARRAAQRERVRILYRRALKDTLNWAVHRHIFYQDASDLRERFDANKDVEDIHTIDRLIEDAEATFNKWRHPDPYIVPWAPGGSKFSRNPKPPEGIEIVYNYGREEND